ncbi:MAG: hydantoinase B/oxoprolinase family protein [Cyanobacteria bacterium P01_D01_bin.6]
MKDENNGSIPEDTPNLAREGNNKVELDLRAEMARSMLDYHPNLKRGDAYINNSPYHGCSHAADQTIMVPVFDAAERHRFTLVAKAHQADIGNAIPTTYHGAALDVYNEGALIFASAKIQSDYRDNEDLIRMCRLRIRVPEQWYGDYLAALGAARIGEREITALAEDMGWETLSHFAGQWFDYSERRMAEALQALPAGRVQASSTHDPFPGTPDDGVTINVGVETDPDQGRICVDLTDNIDALACGLNVSEACTRTSAMIGVFNSIDHSVPKNAGAFRRIDIKLKDNGVVGVPQHPTSCSVATTNLADRVANSVQVAMADLADRVGMAEVGAVIPPSAGVVSGVDPRTGKAYINQIFLGFTGGAASPHEDAWLTIGHVGNGGLCYQDSVEIDESAQPIHVFERRIMIDSEGAGRHRGAPGFYCAFGPVDAPCEVGYVSDGVVNGPKGVRGGLSGGRAGQYLQTADGAREALEACAQVTLEPGQRMISIGCGGGGYGDPKLRDPQRVAKDVADGIVSREWARQVYGVALHGNGEVDAEATVRLRAGN